MEPIETDPTTHPATKAWLVLFPQLSMPERITILRGERRGSIIYRLEGAGPKGGAVIAKHSRSLTAVVEVTIYEEILPHVPVFVPQYYGSLEEPDRGLHWLFIEDAGEVLYSTANSEHRILAAQWLGNLHTYGASLTTEVNLPDRGLDYYLDILHSVRERILGNLENPALQTDDISLLETIVDQFNLIESHWNEIEAVCVNIPKTVVHGDFVGKNVRVRKSFSGSMLLPFDWESAGYGVPAPDLEGLDIAVYRSTISKCWPYLLIEDVEQLAKIGHFCWLIKYVFWASAKLEYPWIEKTMKNHMGYYHSWLRESIRAFGWEE
jgi:hypothetical protein